MTSFTAIEDVWWIAHDGAETIHSGRLAEGQTLDTGQPFFETFINKLEWELRVIVLSPALLSDEIEEDDMVSLDEQLYTTQIDHLLYDSRRTQ